MVKASTRQSGAVSSWSSLPVFDRKRTSRLLPQTANSKPPAAPNTESSRLSDISWRMTRRRAAPIAMRMEISRWRAAARASSRLAILAQAISSTRPTTTIRVKSAVRYWLPVSEKPVAAGRRASDRFR